MNKSGSKTNTKLKTNTPKVEKETKNINTYLLALICFLFAFVLYSNTFKHSYVLDDFTVMSDNFVVKKGVSAIPQILNTTYRYGANIYNDNLYRPLTLIMFAIEWQVSPNNPYLSHILNVLFYALSCFLLLIVLRKYFNRAHPLIPFIITLIYTAHPIHTEVVANIKSRDEIMSFFFLMLSLLTLHTWFDKQKWWALPIAIITFFLALLSKEGVVTMAVLIPLLAWFFTDAKLKNIITASILMFIPVVFYIFLRQLIINKYSLPAPISIADNFLVGVSIPIEHFATAVLLLGKYLLLSIFPYQLVCDYSFSQIPVVGLGNILFILSVLIYAALVFYIIITFKKKDPIAFGILFFILTLSMYSNIIFHVGTSFGERLLFLPSLGICISFVFFLSKLFKINDNKKKTELEIIKHKPLLSTIILIVLFMLGAKTIIRAAEWKDPVTLFGSDVKKSSNSSHLHLYYGISLRDKAMKKENEASKEDLLLKAIDHFEKGIAIYPAYNDCYEQLGLAWYHLKDNTKSLENYNKALEFNKTKASTWNNSGIIYYETNNLQKALEYFNTALKLEGNYVDAFFNRAMVKGRLNDYKGALDDFKKVLEFKPEKKEVYFRIANAKSDMKDYEGAIAEYNRAVEYEPKNLDAINNRGNCKNFLKDYTGAIADYSKAIEIDPNFANAYFNIGVMLTNLNRYEEAIARYKQYIQLNPQNYMAYQRIGNIYLSLKQQKEAKIWLDKAQEILMKNKNY